MELESNPEESIPLLPEVQPNVSLQRKPSIWQIIVPVFFIAFSFTASMAPKVEALSLIFCYKYYLAKEDTIEIPWDNCNIPAVQSLVSEATSLIVFLSYGSTMLLASTYGSLSDRKGRRPVLVTSLIGSIFPYVALILTLRYFSVFDVYLIFISNIIRGLMAGESVLVATANAYLTDCTTPANRTLAFSYFSAVLFLGSATGPVFGSFIIKKTDSIFCLFYIIIAIQIALVMYTALFLTESNVDRKNKVVTKLTFLQNINVFSAFSVFFRTPLKHANRWTLPVLTLVQVMLTMVALPPVLLYAMLKFNWTAYEGGFFISATSVMNVVTMLIVLPVLTKFFHKIIPISNKAGSTEDLQKASCPVEAEKIELKYDPSHSIQVNVAVIRTGLLLKTASFIALGLVTTSGGYLIAGAAEGLGSLCPPSIQSLMTTLVDPSHTGELWGALATLEALAVVVSQFLFNYIYSATVNTMPAFVFFCCAGIVGVSAIFTFFIRPAEKVPDQEA
ncbi:major facilitator superfamily domain-containing protein [Sporodiniella umbellata]|nr:major facilitator superfamily domain-containing protein [Sporodiniella umbellata]